MSEKILSLIGMWWHEHDDIVNVSCSQERVVMECRVCGRIWAWDR